MRLVLQKILVSSYFFFYEYLVQPSMPHLLKCMAEDLQGTGHVTFRLELCVFAKYAKF